MAPVWLLLAAPGYSWLALSCSFLSAPASFGSWPVLAAVPLVSTPGFLLRITLSIIFVCFVVVVVVVAAAVGSVVVIIAIVVIAVSLTLLALVALVGLVTLIALTLVALIILLILIPVLVSIRYPSCFFLT